MGWGWKLETLVFRSSAAQLVGFVLDLKLVLPHSTCVFWSPDFLNPKIPVYNCSVARSGVSFISLAICCDAFLKLKFLCLWETRLSLNKQTKLLAVLTVRKKTKNLEKHDQSITRRCGWIFWPRKEAASPVLQSCCALLEGGAGPGVPMLGIALCKWWIGFSGSPWGTAAPRGEMAPWDPSKEGSFIASLAKLSVGIEEGMAQLWAMAMCRIYP